MLLFALAHVMTPATEEQALIALDRQIQAAMVANDARLLSQKLADDFRFTHGNGSVQDKAAVLRAAAAKPRYYLRRDVISPIAEVHGDIGLVIGNLDVASGPTLREPTRAPVCYALNYVHLYKKRDGRWQLLAHRTTETTKPSGPCPDGS